MSVLMKFASKFKYIGVVLFAALLMTLVTRRWRHTFQPAWIWIAGAVVLALVGVGIHVLLTRRHEKKMAAALEGGLSRGGADRIDMKGEIKALRENWATSLDRLKAANAGAGRTALYRLPWFMIIGEPASGKSTLLRKSGLDFPVGDAAVRGLHGTRNCDWWFANEAIFLDTAGRYVIETQEEEWIAFLGLLARYRKRKPINGVLVAVAANSLLLKSHDELLQDGKRIRNRIDELIDVLGVNFPVYVLVTKVDLISGFAEFFNPLDQRHREQMLGWTLPIEGEARFEAEMFDARFRETIERIYRMRPWVESKVGRRDLGKAFLFPEEFSYLGDPLRTVLEVVFKPNVYQETPVCRGVYFSSGTQVGSPLARALEDMARDLHIPADFGIGLAEEKEVRTYFIKDLVSGQVLTDKDLTWRTGRAEARAKKRRAGWGMVGAGVSALVALFAGAAFVENRDRLEAFEQHLPAAGAPLEVALGAMKARDEAEPASAADVGLNYSDEVIPTIEESYRRVVVDGLVAPSLDGLDAEVQKGVPPSPAGPPDVPAWIALHGQLGWLRTAVTGGLPAELDAKAEEPHLGPIFARLDAKGLAGKAEAVDLRRALQRFGAEGGLASLSDYDRERIESRFAALEKLYGEKTGAWLDRVENFVNQRKSAEGAFRRNYDDAIQRFKAACADVQILPHESPASLDLVATELRSAASGLSDAPAGAVPLTSIAGSEEELTAALKAVLADAPAGGPIADRATKALEPFQSAEITNVENPRHRALLALRSAVEAVMAAEPALPRWPTRIAESDLKRRRTTIDEEIAQAGRETWERIRESVDVLEDEPIVEERKEGDHTVTVRRTGWWDALPLLAEARRADAVKGDYLEQGLKPWLESDRWRTERATDPEAEIFTVRQFQEVILPRLRAEVEFMEVAEEEGRLAREIAREGQDLVHLAVRKWVEDADQYWTRQFQSALPAPAQTLAQVRTQLEELRGLQPSLLLGTMKNIQAALANLTRLAEDPREDPVLAASEAQRAEVARKWSVVFQTEDATALTVHRAVREMSDFSQAIAAVVSPLGTNNEQARRLVAMVLKGGESVLAQAAAAAERLRTGAASGSPRADLAARLTALVDAAWSGLLEKAAEDVNDRWSNVRVNLASATTPTGFQAAFGPAGPFGAFQKDFLGDLFDGPQLLPKRGFGGQKLVLTQGFRESAALAQSLKTGLFDSSNRVRSDRMVLDLQLGGEAAPESLVLEYQPKEGSTERSGKYINGAPVRFDFTWSPSNCQEFRFTVGLKGGGAETHRFTGEWAVAEALRAARREGDLYIWPANPGAWKDAAGQPYEVKLKVMPESSRELVNFYELNPDAGTRSPMEILVQKLPAKAVAVEKE